MADNVRIRGSETGTLIATAEDNVISGMHYQIVQQRDSTTISVSKMNVILKRTLYGEVTPERLQREKADLEHRLDQLS